MARNQNINFARRDSANLPFLSVYHERSHGGPYEEEEQQQQQQQQHQQPSSSPQDGGPWTSSLQLLSVPRGYPAENYGPSQHQQHTVYQQHSSSSSVGRHHPSAGWPPLSGSTASPHGDDSAERAVADPTTRIPNHSTDPVEVQGRLQQQRSPQDAPAGTHRRLPMVPSTAPSRDPPMRLMHSELAVLNAEQYDDGRGGGPGISGPAARRKAHQPSAMEEPAPKKKGRGNAPSATRAGEPEEDKKRTRGRPRLDSTSETPQERRRTQIRLAQRAYRDRKEGALLTLEKEVEDLKAENQKVTEAYQALLARVQGSGSLDDADAGTGSLGAPAKRRTRDDSAASDSPPSEAAQQQQQAAKRARRDVSDDPPSSSTAVTMTTTGPMTHAGSAVAQQPTPLWAGVIVTHEPMLPSSFAPETPYTGAACVEADFFGGGAVAGAPGGYEVLAQATPQNASFAAAMAFDAEWAPGGMATAAAASASASPFSLLPAPASFAYQETTFGRRLHRTLLQRAAMLAVMAHPPPAVLARVFGFTMLFESLDQIKARTLALLSPAERTSLFADRYPFQNLGGAGSHYPPSGHPQPSSEGQPSSSRQQQQLERHPSTSSSSSAPPAAAASPVDRDPYAMGPMDPRVARIRDTLVGLGGQIALPGFDGIFWDPEEVDYYLLQNGVVIPPAADHHIVEIPDGAFGPPPPASSPSTSISDVVDGASSASARSASTTATAATGASAADFLDAHYTTTTTAAPSDLTYAYDGHSSSGSGSSDLHHHLGYGRQPRRRVWRMNVELFVDHLSAKTTCLGRSPGIRPGDVDAAFWASVSDPASTL